MQTIDVQTISISAPRDVVLDLVGDPLQLPRWAPDFARTVRPDGDEHWIVDAGAGELRVRIRVSREHGTVDFLRPGTDRGAFARVVPAGDGSAFSFAQVLPDPDSPEAERARRVVAGELDRVRELSEARAAQLSTT